MPDTTNARAHGGEPTAVADGQHSEAERKALDFLAKVVRVPGVRVNREAFLREELSKLHLSDDAIARALGSSPVLVGVPLSELDRIADEAISYETNKSAAISFVAGIPGGFAMLGTIPADLMQYYMHALRIMQKLAYLYGWGELLPDGRETDDDTLGVLAVFFGVMLGVGGRRPVPHRFRSRGRQDRLPEPRDETRPHEHHLVPGRQAQPAPHRHQHHEEHRRQGILEARPRHRWIRVERPDFHGAPVPVRAPQGAPARDPASWRQRRGVGPASSGCVHKGADTRDGDEYQEGPARQSEGRDGRRQERGLGHRRRSLERRLQLQQRQGTSSAPQVTTPPTRPGPGLRSSAVPSPGLVTVYTPPLFALLTRLWEGKPATICG